MTLVSQLRGQASYPERHMPSRTQLRNSATTPSREAQVDNDRVHPRSIPIIRIESPEPPPVTHTDQSESVYLARLAHESFEQPNKLVDLAEIIADFPVQDRIEALKVLTAEKYSTIDRPRFWIDAHEYSPLRDCINEGIFEENAHGKIEIDQRIAIIAVDSRYRKKISALDDDGAFEDRILLERANATMKNSSLLREFANSFEAKKASTFTTRIRELFMGEKKQSLEAKVVALSRFYLRKQSRPTGNRPFATSPDGFLTV
jgi:hypothetical protein